MNRNHLPHNDIQCSHGMTIVEIVVTLSIFVSIMLAVTIFASNIFSYKNSVSSSYTTVQSAEAILKTMTKEIRMASPGNNGSYPLQITGSSTLTFYADLSGMGAKTRIRYSLVGNKIYRAILIPTGSPLTYTGIESTTTLVNDVRNGVSTPVFEYYDDNYDGSEAPLSQPVNISLVRLIKINITLDTDPNRSPLPRTYSTQVTLRNLKDNL